LCSPSLLFNRFSPRRIINSTARESRLKESQKTNKKN
jgi:hypothetical protein